MSAEGTGAGRRSRALVLTAAGLAVGGGVHLGLAAEHGLGEHGIRFLVAGVAQVALAGVLWWRPSRRVLEAAVALSLLLTAAWMLTRTPAFGDAEPVDALGAATAGLEAATALLAAMALRSRTRAASTSTPYRSPTPRTMATSAATGGIAVLVGVVGGWAGPSTHDDHHHGADHHRPAVAAADERPSIFGDLFADHHGAAGAAAAPAAAAGAAPDDEGGEPHSGDHPHEDDHQH